MLCPNCQVVMRMAVRQGVEIDYCPNCRGVWLDKGELDKLMERAADEQRASFTPSASPARSSAPVERSRPVEDYDYDDEVLARRPLPPRPDHRDERRPEYRDERRYDDDDRYEKRYDDDYDPRTGKKRKRGFLDELFDIFD